LKRGRKTNYKKILSYQELQEKYPTKKCKDCKEVKSRDKFYENSGSTDGLASYCARCVVIRTLKSRSLQKNKQDKNKA
jgi:hypothetical protein